jgi:hypothetical protein
VYRWDFDGLARQEFATLSQAGQTGLAAFMNAAVIVDPIEYQRHPREPSDPHRLLRTLHFGPHYEGLVTFLVYAPDDLVLVVKIQWLGE